MMTALQDVRLLTLALNLPGPLAVARLVHFGATATKIEPPAGDGLARGAPAWYAALHAEVQVRRADLKTDAGRAALEQELAATDLLITATRPAALGRLGLDWQRLHERYPRLCQVAIVGHAAPHQHLPGHDLTYLASAGVIAPPELPRTLAADILGGERSVSTALALLLERARSGAGAYAEVALADAATVLSLPLHHALTGTGRRLGGGFAGYNLYETADGWIAVAALEAHFWQRLRDELGCTEGSIEELRAAFRARTAADWECWARERDLPIVAVSDTLTTA